jgi:hypothetical protein
MTMIHRMWVPMAGEQIHHPFGLGFFWCIVGGVFLVHVAACNRWWEKVSLRLPAPALGGAYVMALLLCMVMAPSVEKPFIYFQF